MRGWLRSFKDHPQRRSEDPSIIYLWNLCCLLGTNSEFKRLSCLISRLPWCQIRFTYPGEVGDKFISTWCRNIKALVFIWSKAQLSLDSFNFRETRAVSTPTRSHGIRQGAVKGQHWSRSSWERSLARDTIQISCFVFRDQRLNVQRKCIWCCSHNWTNWNNKEEVVCSSRDEKSTC